MQTVNVILAAGFGTRMKSDLPKVMHPLLGRAMIDWAVGTAEAVSQRKPVVVVGHGREQVESLLGERADYVVQGEMLGTGHAVQQTMSLLQDEPVSAVLVTYADMPLLRQETLVDLISLFHRKRAQDNDVVIAMLTIERDDPQGFGRIVRDSDGEIQAIVEEVDCTDEQKRIRELNPGVYCFDAGWLWQNIGSIPISSKGEYYLTDMVGIAVSQGKGVVTSLAPAEDLDGINTRAHLANATAVLRDRILARHMEGGVTVVDPPSTYIEADVEIGQDTTVLPGCVLQGNSRIGRHSVIGPYSQVADSTIGDKCRVTYSVVEEAHMGDGGSIGPFGHLRPGAHLAEDVHMGNFGEVKNSYLGPGVKMGHFSYIGDAHVESNVNIGAGTITCNFDGTQKNRTRLGKDAFIGSDTLLVAPVEVGSGAQTGAGSVVTRNVPENTIVYGVPARPHGKTTGDNTDEEEPQ